MAKALTKKLIETTISAGVPDGKPYAMLWDTSPPGFGVRIRKSGGASCLYRYRPKGAPRGAAMQTLTLGTWPALGVEAARALAVAHAGKIALGGNPGEEIKQARLRSRSVVSTALDDYAASLTQRHIVKRDQVMASLRRGFAPQIKSELGSLDLRTLVGLIDKVATTRHRRKDGSPFTVPGAATYFRKSAHGFLGWAALHGLVPVNALAGYREPAKSREERRIGKQRQGRALADREIAAVWKASMDMAGFGALVRLGMLSSLRRNELAELRWSDVRDESIVVPEHRTKMGKEHQVPLTAAMRAILAGQKRSAGGLVFPSPMTGSVMAGWSKWVPKLVKTSGVHFRLHDLRRTCRTLMSRLGVAEAVAETAIGHTKGGLIAIYDKHDLWDERVEAFEKVSTYILALVEDAAATKNTGHVVPCHQGKK